MVLLRLRQARLQQLFRRLKMARQQFTAVVGAGSWRRVAQISADFEG